MPCYLRTGAEPTHHQHLAQCLAEGPPQCSSERKSGSSGSWYDAYVVWPEEALANGISITNNVCVLGAFSVVGPMLSTLPL